MRNACVLTCAGNSVLHNACLELRRSRGRMWVPARAHDSCCRLCSVMLRAFEYMCEHIYGEGGEGWVCARLGHN